MGRKLTSQEAADYLRIRRDHLRQLHFRGDGPPRIRISSRVYVYDEKQLDEWMDSRILQPDGAA